MTDTTQTTTTSAPTGQAGAATAPAATGNTSESAAPQGSLLGGAVGDAPKGTDQGQAATENKTTPEAPAAIEVKLPDGVVVDQTVLDAFQPAFQELKLNSEQASKLAAKYAEVAEAANKAQYEAFKKQGDDWMDQVKKHPEYGGAKLPETVAMAQKAVLKFGGPQLVAALDKYGIGNLPELVVAFAQVGKSMAEDTSSVKPPPGGQVALSEADKNKLRYDKSR